MPETSTRSPFPPESDGVATLTPFEAEVVAVFADLVTLLGLPKSMGEIYGLIFASPEPLAFSVIEQKLRLSKGSVSQGLRSLRELGAIQATGEDGERRERWAATIELRKLIGTILRERLVPYLGRQDQRLANADALLAQEALALGEREDQHLDALRNRLDKLHTWQRRARTVLPLIGKML